MIYKIMKTIDLIYKIIFFTFVTEKQKESIIIKINRYENEKFNRTRSREITRDRESFE